MTIFTVSKICWLNSEYLTISGAEKDANFDFVFAPTVGVNDGEQLVFLRGVEDAEKDSKLSCDDFFSVFEVIGRFLFLEFCTNT